MSTSTDQQENVFKHFKSLDFLPMFNYYKVEDTGDLRFLLKLNDYEELPDVETSHLVELWDSLKLDVQDVTIKKNRKSEVIFNKSQELSVLTGEYTLIQNLIKFLWKYKVDEHVITLEKLGYKINESRDWHQELLRIQKRSQIKLNLIDRVREEIDGLTNVTGSSNATIYDEVDSIESILKKEIDLHKTTMSKWLTMKFKAIEMNNKKSTTNGR